MVGCSVIICMNCCVSQVCIYGISPHGEVEHKGRIMYGDKRNRKKLAHG